MSEHCPITEEQVGCLVDGELTGQEQRRVAAHVSVCEHCSALAGRILAGKRFLSASSPEVDPPAGSWDRLVVALDQKQIHGLRTNDISSTKANLRISRMDNPPTTP